MPTAIEILTPGDLTWRHVGRRMLELERAEWGARAFSSREMRRQVTDPSAVVATLWDHHRLIGFAVAGPAWSRARASLFNVLIDPAYRGRGLVWPLIAEVGRVLAARGFAELDVDARVENGFADAIERRYGARASVVEADHPSPYGPQRTIRVALVARRRCRLVRFPRELLDELIRAAKALAQGAKDDRRDRRVLDENDRERRRM